MFNTGGIDAVRPRGERDEDAGLKLERLRDLLVPVLENPREAGELHWTGVKSMDFSRSSLGWRWVTAPRCATSMS